MVGLRPAVSASLLALVILVAVVAAGLGYFVALKSNPGPKSTSASSTTPESFQQIDYDWHHLTLVSPTANSSSFNTPANCNSIGFSADCAFYATPGSRVLYGVSVESNLTATISIGEVVNQTVTTHHNSTSLDTSVTSRLSSSTVAVSPDSPYSLSGSFGLPASTAYYVQGVDFVLHEDSSGITLVVDISYTVSAS